MELQQAIINEMIKVESLGAKYHSTPNEEVGLEYQNACKQLQILCNKTVKFYVETDYGLDILPLNCFNPYSQHPKEGLYYYIDQNSIHAVKVYKGLTDNTLSTIPNYGIITHTPNYTVLIKYLNLVEYRE